MSILNFFKKTGTISRLRDLSNGKKAYSATATIEGAFQDPANRRMNTELDQIQSKTWNWYVDIEGDIKEGDLITIEGKIYKVDEIINKDYGTRGISDHKHVILVEYEDGN